MLDRLFVQLFLAATICTIIPATGFLWDKEVEIVRSKWSSVVVVVRHVEYIGVIDNGTLDCSVPGFTKYRWTIINKATKENYAESYIMGSGDAEIPDSQSKIKIGNFILNIEGLMIQFVGRKEIRTFKQVLSPKLLQTS